MKISNTLVGILVGLLGIGVVWYAQALPRMPGQDVGPGMFPTLVGTGFVICAALLIRRDRKMGTGKPWLRMPPELRDKRVLSGFLLVPFSLVLYVTVSEALGFIAAAALLLLALFVVFRVRPLPAVVLAVAGALAIHFLFYTLLEVPLPWGILDPIAW